MSALLGLSLCFDFLKWLLLGHADLFKKDSKLQPSKYLKNITPVTQ